MEETQPTQTEQINKETLTEQINEETQTEQINEETQTEQINKETQTEQINKETQTEQINEETQTEQINEETNEVQSTQLEQINEETNEEINEQINEQIENDSDNLIIKTILIQLKKTGVKILNNKDLIKVLVIIMENIENIEELKKNSELKQKILLHILNIIIDESPINEKNKEILHNLINDDTVSETIDLIIKASKGELKINANKSRTIIKKIKDFLLNLKCRCKK